MKKIFHISDLHFGVEDNIIIELILKDIEVYKPDLVVVSGDLTQRAKSLQYLNASEFLSKINYPQIVVPGNHDISLWNIFRRFFNPLKRFKKFISDDEFPLYADEEMTIMGVNSARSLTIKSGRISVEQINYIKKIFCNKPEPHFKGIVIHHNLIPFLELKKHKNLGRSNLFITELNECGIDMLFSGHLHKTYFSDSQEYFKDSNSIIMSQAGTSSSKRVRGEKNNYNLIEIDSRNIILKSMSYNGEFFIEDELKKFLRKELNY